MRDEGGTRSAPHGTWGFATSPLSRRAFLGTAAAGAIALSGLPGLTSVLADGPIGFDEPLDAQWQCECVSCMGFESFLVAAPVTGYVATVGCRFAGGW